MTTAIIGNHFVANPKTTIEALRAHKGQLALVTAYEPSGFCQVVFADGFQALLFPDELSDPGVLE